jgi:hypothetical protein
MEWADWRNLKIVIYGAKKTPRVGELSALDDLPVLQI